MFQGSCVDAVSVEVWDGRVTTQHRETASGWLRGDGGGRSVILLRGGVTGVWCMTW